MLLIALLLASGALAGAISGALTARWLIRRPVQPQPIPLRDLTLDAEIEQAATAWANAQGRPEAAGLAADKMHLLHRLARRRGWWS
jgi:hypothetical protein